MYNNQYICVFDSGFGGLSILKKLLLKPPNEHYVYFMILRMHHMEIEQKMKLKI